MAKNWRTEVVELLLCYFASVPADRWKFSFLIIIELFVINLALVLADGFQIPVLRQAFSVGGKLNRHTLTL
ncbi:hypothetical protein [Mucilaginibacter sp.]|uniref:hypothetical protein n=1 Tax=Mucilaginibacter sp. TaxID=1882438 RepID=UPI003B00A097